MVMERYWILDTTLFYVRECGVYDGYVRAANGCFTVKKHAPARQSQPGAPKIQVSQDSRLKS